MMRKIMLVLSIICVIGLSACSKTDDKKNKDEDTLLVKDTIQMDVVSMSEENAPEVVTVSEETPYLVKNYDTNEIMGYLQEDEDIVKKVIEDVSAFYRADTSMKPDTVEETLKTLRENRQVSKKIYTDDFIEETIEMYKTENIQEDFYDIQITQLRFKQDKNVVTVVSTVSYLDTKMELKIFNCESAFEYDPKYDVWTFCGNYDVNEAQ